MNHFSRECLFLYRRTSETRCWLFCVLRTRVLLLRESSIRQRCAAYMFHLLSHACLHTHAHICWYDGVCLPGYLIQSQSLHWHFPFWFIALLFLVSPPPLCFRAFPPLTAESLHLLHSVFTPLLNIAILIQNCYFIRQKNQTYYLMFVYSNPLCPVSLLWLRGMMAEVAGRPLPSH